MGEKAQLRARVSELEAEIVKIRAERDKFVEMLLAKPAQVTLPPGGYPGSLPQILADFDPRKWTVTSQAQAYSGPDVQSYNWEGAMQ